MIDTFVPSQLGIWAEWKLRRENGGTGFPRKVSFLKMAPQPSGYWTPEMDSLAYDMDKCVMALDEILYRVILACYTHTTPLEQKLIFCDCKKDTYYRRLDQAHKLLLGFMNDVAAGIPLKTIPKVKAKRKSLKEVA